MPGCWVRSISAHAAVVADKTISLHITQPLVSKVVHDKFPFVHEVVANGPRLCIVCLSNLLMRMCRNGHSCSSALNFECKIKFYVHCFVQNLIFLAVFLPRFGPVWPLLVHMRRNAHKATFGQIFNPIFEIPIGCFLFEHIFGGMLIKN